MLEERFSNSGELDRGVFDPFYGEYRKKSVNDKLLESTDTPSNLSGLEIELSIYDGEKNLLYWDRGVDYEVSNGNLLIDVYSQIEGANIPDGGNYILRYNFFDPSLTDNIYVKSISDDGREIAVRPDPNASQSFIDSFNSLFGSRFKNTDPSDLDEGESSLTYVGNFRQNRYNHVLNWSLVAETSSDGDVKIENGDPVFKNEAVIRFETPISDVISVGDNLGIDIEKGRPYFDRFTIFRDEAVTPVNNLADPDFSIEVTENQSDRQFETFEDLTNVGGIETSKEFLQNSVSSEVDLNVDFSEFENFVQYSSAEERIKNFRYKIRKIYGTVQEIKDTEAPGGKETLKREVESFVSSFDAYERWLFRSKNGYPKNESGGLANPENQKEWFREKLEEAKRYDQQNQSALRKQIPEFMKENPQNDRFVLFVDMIGHWFDVNWLYIRHMENLSESSENAFDPETLSPNLSKTVAESFGFETFDGFNAERLFDNLFDSGKIEELFGSENVSQSIKKREIKNGKVDLTAFEAQQQVWRRLLQNLIHFYKNKGTPISINGLASVFGLPTNPLIIREYGGGTSGSSKKKIRKSSNFVSLLSSQNIEISWKDEFLAVPEAIEMRFRSEFQGGSTLKLLEILGVLEVRIEKNINTGKAKFVIEIRKADGTTAEVETGEVSVFNGQWTNLLLQFQEVQQSGREEIDLFVKQRSPLGNIRFSEQTSVRVDTQVLREYRSAKLAIIGGLSQNRPFPTGVSFVGDIDQINIWKNPLPESVFEDHVFIPEKTTFEKKDLVNTKIEGNIQKTESLQENTEDNELFYRIDFEDTNPGLGGGSSAVLNGDQSLINSYERINFFEPIQIGNVPFVKNKIRTRKEKDQINLSPNKSKGKVFDRTSADSRKLGIFLSPYTSANRDAFSELSINSINSVLGNPRDQFRTDYHTLDGLHRSYWNKYEEPIDTTVFTDYIDEFYDAIFNHIRKSVPARASYYDGVVIEPTALERDREPIPTGSIQEK